MNTASALTERLIKGERRALSRLISWAEDGDRRFPEALAAIYPRVGRAWRIGITGPPGAGKSTLIRCINRLEEHQKGKITVIGKTLGKDIKNIDAIRSDVGMVFQSFNLFPHLSVLDNITLPYRITDALQLDSEVRSRAESLAEGMGIGDKLRRMPGKRDMPQTGQLVIGAAPGELRHLPNQ